MQQNTLLQRKQLLAEDRFALELLAGGSVRPIVTARFPNLEAAKVHELLESGRVTTGPQDRRHCGHRPVFAGSVGIGCFVALRQADAIRPTEFAPGPTGSDPALDQRNLVPLAAREVSHIFRRDSVRRFLGE
jgi:hypothetical protein